MDYRQDFLDGLLDEGEQIHRNASLATQLGAAPTEADRQFLLNYAERTGQIAPSKDGMLKEFGQGVVYGGMGVMHGLLSTAEELGFGSGMRQWADDVMARNQQYAPYEGYSGFSLNPTDIARTVGTGAAQSVGSMAVGAGTTIATGNPAVGTAAMTAFMFGQIYGDRVKEYRDVMRGVPDGQVKALALLSSVGESLIESYIGPEQAVVKLFGKSAGEKAVGAAVRGLVKKVGKDEALKMLGGGEATAELAKIVGKDVSDQVLGKAVKKLGQSGLERLATEAVKDFAHDGAKKSMAALLANAAKKVGKEAAIGYLTEGSEEVSQMYWNELVKAMGTHHLELPSWQKVAEEFSGGAWTGLFMGGGEQMLSSFMDRAADRRYAMGEVRQMGEGEAVPEDAKPVEGAAATSPALSPEEQAARDARKSMAEKVATMSGMDVVWLTPEQIEAERQRRAERLEANGQATEEAANAPVGGWYHYDKERGKGTAYINPEDTRGVDFVIGHELYHDMMDSEHGKSSGIGQAVRRVIREAVKGKEKESLNPAAQKLYERIQNLYTEYKAGSEDFNQEFEADIWGHLFTDNEFMTDLGAELERRQQGLGVKFIEAIRDFVGRIIDAIKGDESPESSRLLNEYEQTREALAKLAADYTETNVKAVNGALQSLHDVLYRSGPAARDAEEAQREANKQAGHERAKEIAVEREQERERRNAEMAADEEQYAREQEAANAEKRKSAEERGKAAREKEAAANKAELDRLDKADAQERKDMAANNREGAELAEEQDRLRKGGREGRKMRGRTRNYQDARKKGVSVPNMTHPDGSKVPEGTIYAVVDAAKGGDIVTSYDGEGYDQALQNSDTGTQATELIGRHSDNPNAALMLGSDSTSQGIPVVDPDTGDVVIHNTGVMIRRMMAEKGTDKEYNEKLRETAKRLKVPFPEDARQPMLVAYLPEGMSRDEKIEQAKKGNLTTTRSVDAGQRAAADATLFATDDGQKVLSMLPDADSDRLVSEANSAFVKAAYAKLAKEDGDLVDGRPTDKFNDRLENAMMSLLFSGLKEEDRVRLVGDLVNDARNLGLADFKSALAVKAAKLNLIALKNKDFDLRPELSKATRDIVKWKRSGMKFAGDYANQLNFDPKDNMPEADKPLFLALGNASQVSAKAVRQVLDAYIDGARAELQGQTLIGDKVTKATLVQRMADASAEIISSRKYSLGGTELKSAAKQDGIDLDKETQEFRDAYARYRGTRQWLKAPNGKSSKLTARQWTQVRTPSFKKWAGDWEAWAEGKEQRKADSISQAVEIIKSSGILNKPIENNKLGMTASISGKDLSKMESEKAMRKSVSPRLHALAIANVDKLFRNAFMEIAHPDTKGRKEVTQTHRLGSLLLDTETNEFVPVMLTVFEYKKDGNKVYSIEAVDVQKYENSAGQLAAVADGERQAPIAEFINTISQHAKNVNSKGATKIIDENGEPMVVYHGTKSRFYEFTDVKMGKGGAKNNRDGNLYGNGYYFTDDYYSAQTYGRRVLECFLNIKNPSRTSTMRPENDGLMVNSGFHKTYLATSPTQIKSATDNVGTFSNENPDIRYSLTEAQRRGAEDLDIDLDKETQEFRDVFARYHGTRQWMKAPNGSRTNLSARQWVQVRTPAFKQWFGDWENETQNNSKVVDENGEPKIVYHGTVNGAFTVFDKDRIGERWNADEIGFFFTSDEAIGIDYTIPYGSKEGEPHLFNVYLNIKKPLMINSKWFRENYNRSISRYDAIEIWDDNQADILDAFNQGEYDGIVINPTGMGMPQPKMYIAMESNQIKSATDNVGTFSEENPDIRYSLVTDEKINDEFKDDGKTIVTYRSALLGDDGRLYPPMATRGGEGMELGKTYKSDEHPELRNKKGKFPLKSAMWDSGAKGEVPAAYNPYFHSQPGVLNDQFSVAYDKSRMVTVRCRVLKSDIESGYQAEGAKDPVGFAEWATSGPVTRQMRGRGGRSVILSRYIMPVEIVPDVEVARMIKDYIGGQDVTVPWNVVPPNLRDELVKAGVKVGSEEDFRQAEQKRTRRYSLIGKEEDDAYMAAAGKGDTATAQKMVDKAAAAAGYTIKAYHGTPNGTFTVFRGWQYFTENKSYADIYQNQGASSNGYKPTGENPRTYDVYLKTDKPFDTRNETERKIFEDEFLGKWGNGTPLSERDLPDWTDGDDLVEFFEENGYDYDAIYLDEGATGGYGYEVKDRGVAIVIKNPEQIKSADPITLDDSDAVIPLSRRFNENEPDIRYSLIGPQGASRLGRTSAVAEQMEKKGKTADQIWAATGWERGADGKWRTEIKPLKVFPYVEKDPSQRFSDFLASRKAEDISLKNLVSSKELFKAYPELNNITVERSYEAGTRGTASLNDGKIYVNERLSMGAMEDVLTHEIQHLIQEIEGFAKGGTPGATAWLGTERQFAVREFNKLLDNTLVPDTIEEYAKNAWGSRTVTPEIEKAYKQYVKDLRNPSDSLLRALQKAAGDNVYYKLAGEVEARNAVSRSPAYGRRFLRPELTESVKREEQYVRYSLISKKEDAAYMDAVSRGDMETAQKMVDDAAERNGYSADDSWRKQHRAPNRKSGNPNLENIKDSDLVPDDYWDHPEWYQSSDMEREAFWTVRKHIARAEEKKAKGDNSPTFMKVYRAVSKSSNKREERVRNGDWVTPLKAYAIQEGRMNPEGYRIIQTSARLQDLYWDGNSIAEMGYDDGQNYTYKDTANNRKLLDAVTYDDDGNVIPLSKRFNKRDIRTRYSLRRNQSNPIVSDGKIRADYQELLDNGRYTPEHVAEWEAGAVQWIRKVGGVENAVGLIVDGLEPSGKIGTMARRLAMESDTFKALPQDKQLDVEMRNIMQGTEWGREGFARRVASMTLDSAAKVRRIIDAIRSKLTPEQRDKMREDVLRDTGIDLDKLPDDIHQDREKLDHLITATLASKATTKDKLYEYWVNAILSAPMTHVANTVGNLANFAYELGVKRLAEATVNHFAKRPDAARFSDFRAMWASVDWKNAWRSAVQAFNIEVLDASGKYVEGAAPAIEGKKGRIIRIPGRFLRAADEFAKAIIVPIETAAMADRLGRQQNLEGAELDAFIKRQLRDADSEAAAYGRRRSLELTFQEDPGKIVTTLVALKNGDSRWATIVKYLFPFMKTPYNLLRQGIRKSPLGTLSLLDEGIDILRGKRKADSDFIAHAAEQVVAWSLVGMALAMGGGDNDDEPPRLIGSSKGGAAGERMFRGQHVPAYSIRIGDKYYSYKRIEPLSTMLALIADGLESYRMAKTEEGASKALRQMFTGTARLTGEKSYLNTFSQIVQLFDEPERSIGSWTTDFAASWMPNAVRQASNAFDDVRRDPSVRTSGARWWKDQFHLTLSKAGVMRMAPKVDCFGRPITKDDAEKAGPGDILWRLLVPANTKSADAMDPAEKVIWNWNIRNLDEQYWPGVPSYRFSLDGVKYEMHGKDYADFSMESGRAAHRRILELINTGRIKPGNPREEDIAMIKQALNVSRKLTRQKYVRLHRCDKVK